MTKIELAGQEFSLEILQEEPARHSASFERARKTPGHGLCLCIPGGRRLQVKKRDGLYHLAVWPLDGQGHHSRCFFYRTPDDLTGASGYTAEALHEREDGSLDIRADIPLKVRTEDRNPAGDPAQRSAGSGQKRASMAMLGLLHAYWERARLNQWHPGWNRNWSRCRWELGNIEGRLNGEDIREAMYVVPAFDAEQKDKIEAGFERFRDRLAAPGPYRARGVVIGEAKALTQSEYGYRLNLRHQAQTYYANRALIAKVSDSYRHVMAQMSNFNARVIALLVVELSKKGFLTVVDISLMLTSRNYIPVESSFELAMADALTSAKRSFIKPLRYDGMEDEFPDFRLTDTAPETIVEVYGMMGVPEYERRKAEKQASYRAKRIPVIEWDTRSPIPSVLRGA